MNSEKIRTYDELSINEQEVLDSFTKMKLMCDYSRFNLYKFQIADLLEDYEQLKQLREVIQMKYFAIFDELKKQELIEGELDAVTWGINRENEMATWESEMQVLDQINSNFVLAIQMIESGEAERQLIGQENW